MVQDKPLRPTDNILPCHTAFFPALNTCIIPCTVTVTAAHLQHLFTVELYKSTLFSFSPRSIFNDTKIGFLQEGISVGATFTKVR